MARTTWAKAGVARKGRINVTDAMRFIVLASVSLLGLGGPTTNQFDLERLSAPLSYGKRGRKAGRQGAIDGPFSDAYVALHKKTA